MLLSRAGYNNNKCFNDAWLAHLASNHSPRPKSLPWSKSLNCSFERHDISSAQQQTNIYEGVADVSQHKSPVVNMWASLPVSVADAKQCDTSIRVSSIKTAYLFESVPVAAHRAPSSMSSLRPGARSAVLPSASTMPSACDSESTCLSPTVLPGVSQDSLRALENLLGNHSIQFFVFELQILGYYIAVELYLLISLVLM